LYYLQSRYYDPETGRFINGDMPEFMLLSNTPHGHNLFAYCENEPVVQVDYSGFAAGAIALGAAAAVADALAKAIGATLILLGIIIIFALIMQLTYTLIQWWKRKQYEQVLKTSNELGKIAGKYGNLKCKEAASAMQNYLKKCKLHGAVITITFSDPKRGWIWSESKKKVISENGVHVGVLYQGVVHCNVHPLGLPEQTWINDFYGNGKKNVSKVKF